MPMSYFYYVSFRERRALAVWHLYATYFHHDKFLPYYVSIILRARRKVNFVFAIMCNFFATWKLWALIIFLSRIVYANIRFGCKYLQYHSQLFCGQEYFISVYCYAYPVLSNTVYAWRNIWHMLFDDLTLQKISPSIGIFVIASH